MISEVRQLTGLRGVVALDVVLGHYGSLHSSIIGNFIFHDVAVDIFFCLSSFTLCLVYISKRDFFSVRDFVVARVARIYPMYLVAFLFSFLIALRFDPSAFDAQHLRADAIHFVSQLFLAAALPVPKISGFWDIPAWSVSVEVCCYLLLFPGFVRCWRGLSSIRSGVLLCFMFACVLTDFWAFRHGYEPVVNGIGYGPPSKPFAYWVALIRATTMFGAGLALYVIYARRKGSGRLGPCASNCAQGLFVLSIVLSCNGVFDRQLVVFTVPFLLLGLMDDRSLASRLLSTLPFVCLGRISYSLYLLHVPLLILQHVSPFYGTSSSNMVLPFLISLLLATICFLAVEMPGRSYIRTFMHRSVLGRSARAIVD